MTEQELARYDDLECLDADQWQEVKAELLAEVRRLQGLIKQAEWDDIGHVRETGGRAGRCPWCHGAEWVGHLATCPAFPPSPEAT